MGKLTNFWWLISILCFTYTCQVNCQGDPRVTTNSGVVIGSVVRFNDLARNRQVQVNQFLGIPFAKPPLGELRFQKPQPAEPWPQPLVCKTMPKGCIQFATAPYPWEMPNTTTEISEDCLYMNIWVPRGASSQNKKSVLVWLFGGGWYTGSIGQEIYDGRALSGIGDIIVVTTNYRLASLGFWSNNKATAPGNVGLWDNIMVLQWVQDNIGHFGGDKNSVTLAGESAGSISISLFAVSNYSRHLFHRQIMESGSGMWTAGNDCDVAVIKRSLAVAKQVGCANDTYNFDNHPDEIEACMRGIDAVTIVKAEGILSPGAPISYSPRCGDELFPTNPRESLKNGDAATYPLFIGNNWVEGEFKITTGDPDLFGFFGEKNPFLNRRQAVNLLKKLIPKSKFPAQDKLIEFYLPRNITGDCKDEVANAVGEFGLLCPTVFYAQLQAKKNTSIYYYMFDHKPANRVWSRWMRTTHFEEVQFVFGAPLVTPSKYPADERRLSRQMMEDWARFTKTGIPKPGWYPFTTEHDDVMVYTQTGDLVPTSLPYSRNCDFFKPYFGL